MNRIPIDAALLPAVHEAALAGARPPAPPRPQIGASWQRTRRHGLDPDAGGAVPLLPPDEVTHLRETSRLGELLPQLRGGLREAVDAVRHLIVVADDEGRLLWREGTAAVRRSADRLGFQVGATWTEEQVGTNGIGLALVERVPAQVHSAEHYIRTHHSWTCAAAPLHDPRDGRLLGVVNVSGPAQAFNPATLALVTAVAKVGEAELRARHWESVDRLRAVAAPMLARVGGRALAVDRDGWTAAVTGMAPVGRVVLPRSVEPGRVWLPSLGPCRLEPLPDGWLVRVDEGDDGAPPSRVRLDLRQPHAWTVTVSGEAGHWSHELSPRHAELLYVLARHREGRTAAQLAEDLFGDASRTVTVRAEMSRIRRTLAGVLRHRPYRFADGLDVELLLPPRAEELLPSSRAPVVVAARGGPPAG
ncbi:transcriptional regulator [Streptomyces mashuensis]|uniref:Transcriptional regulator n=1 Tax=Streptomyces mashuensis TaxID=33904 RepID=A0A919ATH8_9ACTN|nr:helix-turn-helix domain-containing protein [Streptomyces mashuensis]GHF25525.1 transcriptional regulator [Streptomyces mashuensis]